MCRYIICVYLVNFIRIVSDYFNWLFFMENFYDLLKSFQRIRDEKQNSSITIADIFTNTRFERFCPALPYTMLQQLRIPRRTSKKVERVRKQRGTKCFKAPTRFYKFFKTYHRDLHRLMQPVLKRGSRSLVPLDVELVLASRERVFTRKRRVIFLMSYARLHKTNRCTLRINRDLLITPKDMESSKLKENKSIVQILH